MTTFGWKIGVNAIIFCDIWSSSFNRFYLDAPCLDLPEPPVDVVVAELTSDSVTLSWNSGNDDVTESYIIRYSRLNTSGISGIGSYAQVTDVTDTEYTVSDLVPFTAYSFQVMAVNSIGTSAPSAMLDVTTHESSKHNQFSVLSTTTHYLWPLHCCCTEGFKGLKIVFCSSIVYQQISPLDMQHL